MGNVIDLMSLLRELDGTLRKSEQRVLDIVLRDPAHISSIRGEELAKMANVSPPSVTRFCRQAGFDNYRDFKIKLAQNVAIWDYYDPGKLADGRKEEDKSELESMAEDIVNFAQNAIRQTSAGLNFDKISQAITMLDSAQKILIVGMGGASAILADIMMNRMFRLGYQVNVTSDGIHARMAAAVQTNKDLTVVISATGDSPDTLDAVSISAQNGAGTISVTRLNSPLSKKTDLSIETGGYEDGIVLKPATIRYSYMVIIDILAYGLAYKNKERSREILKRQQAVVSHYKGNYTKDFLGD